MILFKAGVFSAAAFQFTVIVPESELYSFANNHKVDFIVKQPQEILALVVLLIKNGSTQI